MLIGKRIKTQKLYRAIEGTLLYENIPINHINIILNNMYIFAKEEGYRQAYEEIKKI
jgi:hypothetical protein